MTVRASLRIFGLAAVFVSTLVCGALALGTGPASRQWTTFQQGSDHTGHAHVSLNPKHFETLWQKTVASGQGRDLNPVAASAGKLFVSEVGYLVRPLDLCALSASTGDSLWKVDVGPVYSMSPPAYGSGNVYVQTVVWSGEAYLSAYDAESGSLIFRTPYPDQWGQHNSPTVFNRTVYINGGTFGGMCAFDAFTGQRQWEAGLPQYDLWSPAVDERRAFAYVGEGEYYKGLFVLDRMTGVELLRIFDPGFQGGVRSYSAPVLGGQNDVLSINAGRLVSFDVQGGRVRWEVQRTFAGQPAIAHGVIFAIDEGTLSARDERSGAALWSWSPPEGALLGYLLVTDSHVFAHTRSTVYGVDLKARESVWSHPLTVQSYSLGAHLAYADGILFMIEPDFVTAVWLGPGRRGLSVQR
ncbi:MAG TPA: PQQ-binding-like beta-propeller repeat protein [Thermoanaerobaculia bacterium]